MIYAAILFVMILFGTLLNLFTGDTPRPTGPATAAEILQCRDFAHKPAPPKPTVMK
jgi:hypothetical protein